MSASVIEEGFLCPTCLKDLKSADSLSSHFQTAHTEDSLDVVEQVKGFFGKAKAKAKLLFEEQLNTSEAPQGLPKSDDEPLTRTSRSFSQIQQFSQSPQDSGAQRSHTAYFKSVRDARVDMMVIETNKLIIRLSKLTHDDAPQDEKKRKAYERKIVPWAEDNLVKVCRSCEKKFNLTRRRHHCRLCGGIMCSKCSEFLAMDQAKTLGSSATQSQLSPNAFLRRSNSSSSVDSLSNSEPVLRICKPCRTLIEKHHTKQEERFSKPHLLVSYEAMRKKMEDVEKEIPDYVKMANSLCSGETTYTLEKALTLRQNIAKQFNDIQTLSKRIMTMGKSEEMSATQSRLHMGIHSSTAAFIQEYTIMLPKLPEESELSDLVAQRDEKRRKKIEQELREAKERDRQLDAAKLRQPSSVKHKAAAEPPPRDSVPQAGWKPGDLDTKFLSSDDDPMVQQINIIKNYIKQATQAQKWDEAEMLQENLKHLEDEYYRAKS